MLNRGIQMFQMKKSVRALYLDGPTWPKTQRPEASLVWGKSTGSWMYLEHEIWNEELWEMKLLKQVRTGSWMFF